MYLSYNCLILLGREGCSEGQVVAEDDTGCRQEVAQVSSSLCCCASHAPQLRGVMASESQGAAGQCDHAAPARATPQDKWWGWQGSCWGIRALGSGRRWSHQICWGKQSWVPLGMSCQVPCIIPPPESRACREMLSATPTVTSSYIHGGQNFVMDSQPLRHDLVELQLYMGHLNVCQNKGANCGQELPKYYAGF